MRTLDGIYQLLTPFPKMSFDQAIAVRHGHPRPAEVRGLPYVLRYLIKSGGAVLLGDCGWNTAPAYEAPKSGSQEHDSWLEDLTQLVVMHVPPITGAWRGASRPRQVARRIHWAAGSLDAFEPRLQRTTVGELSPLAHLHELGRLAKLMRAGVALWLPAAAVCR